MTLFKPRTRQSKPAPPPFAALKRMSPEQRSAALAGTEATRWIESAAYYGFVEAQLLHGQRLLAEGDAESARRWFQAAAAAGYARATNMVGRCFEKGWGTQPDPAEAATHYRQAAEQGLDWAQFNLANLLLYGLGIARDRPQASHWYRHAAGQGHAKSMNMLGRFEDEGWTGPRNTPAAAAWYRRAAEAGDYRGQFNHATLLARAGRSKDARPLFQQALAAGDPDFRAEARATLQSSPDPSLRALATDAAHQAAGVIPSSCSGAHPDQKLIFR